MLNSSRNCCNCAMCASPITFDPAGLSHSLRDHPVLAVLRPRDAAQAERQIAAVAAVGLRHIELSWSAQAWWAPFMGSLSTGWPGIRFGAAGLCHPDQIEPLPQLGICFAMSPIGCSAMLDRADAVGITLVPGVFSPTEVWRFSGGAGQGLVKLFPAAALGTSYWRQLSSPLADLPFCIAAGGLSPADITPWLAAGVQAVALGSSLLNENDQLRPGHANAMASFANGRPIPTK
jgi:2-dehydro-3-deoxyphosphogluconate aldolase/(4S)-4-hydroxy-2-oxoglutarate aldolase